MKQKVEKIIRLIPKKKRLSSRRGFSIMELMFAVFVLSVGIIASLSLISSTIKISIDTRNSVIASGLAQEGAELVRNIRDNNMLYTLSDLSIDPDLAFKRSGLALPLNNNNDCTIDVGYIYPNMGGLTCDGSLYPLYLDTGTNTYHNSMAVGRVGTIFRRGIEISYVTNETVNGNANQLTGMNVVSRVWWDGSATMPVSADCNLVKKCIEVKDYLPKRD